MKVILASSIGGAIKENGKRTPAPLFAYNGFLETLQHGWKDNSKVLIISGSPDYYEKNDMLCECLKQSFPMSGLSILSMEICDKRNVALVEQIKEMNVVLLAGGHVPTQNNFFAELGLKEKLADFDGTVIAWSAGSMNCAEVVYAGHEFIAINDGTYIVIEDGRHRLFGEAYRIKDGVIEMICQHGMSVELN